MARTCNVRPTIVYAIASLAVADRYLTLHRAEPRFDTAPFSYTYPTQEEAQAIKLKADAVIGDQSEVVAVVVEGGTIRRATIADYYQTAIDADDAFSLAVQRVFGYGKNRWDIDVAQHPDTAAAFLLKVQAFNAYERACRSQR